MKPHGSLLAAMNNMFSGVMMILRRLAVWTVVLLWGVGAVPVRAANWNPLPDTGQTTCYDVAGNAIACPAAGQPLHGQDAQYQGAAPSYTDNGNGTVTDNNTGLMWSKDTNDINGDGQITYNHYPTGDTMTWQEAVDYCQSLNFASSSKWRLPSWAELESIVDYDRFPQTIDPHFQSERSGYWSMTTAANNTANAWTVNFNTGGSGLRNKTYIKYVRCVRGEEATIGIFTSNNEIVVNQSTGLVWQQRTADTNGDDDITNINYPAGDLVSWQQALDDCERLILADESDWRLPNIRELKSLVDRSTYSPSIDSAFQCDGVHYWSSTTLDGGGGAGTAKAAWVVRFSDGAGGWGDKTNRELVRCVRGGLTGLFAYFGHLQQSPQFGPPGTTFIQSGTGFTANSSVTLHFRTPSGQLLSPVQLPTNGTGFFTTSYTAPGDKPEGTYTWWAVDNSTGNRSEIKGYRITTVNGTEIGLTPDGTINSNLGPVRQNLGFGELTSQGNFDPEKETFVIVHGMNPTTSTALPGWVKEMGIAIKDGQKSPAKGSNVLYWNWQQEAMQSYGPGVNDDSCNDVVTVPFDKTEDSGKNLAKSMDAMAINGKRILENYDKSIHIIGHSLGTLVATYVARYAKKKDLPFADNIDHLVFLDSPCWGSGSIPGGKFLHDNKNEIFFDNYISDVGRPYSVADVNVWLTKAASWGLFDAHSYSYYWYWSSVTNFDDKDLLEDSSSPTSTMPWGFYWWEKSHQAGAQPNYKQLPTQPAYSLTLVSAAERRLAGLVYGAISAGLDGSAELLDQILEYAQWTGKIVTILAARTFTTAVDAAGYVTDAGAHALYNTLGYLTLSHSSTGVLAMPVDIPAGANALSFGVEFLYGNSDTMLEVFLNGQPVYHTSGDLALGEGLQLIPWINVEPSFAGQRVTVTLRLSNPQDGVEGKIRIDDLVIARIKSAETFPWTMFLPAMTGAGSR